MKYIFEEVRAIKNESITPKDVVCIRADRNYTEFFLKGGRKIVLAKTLKQCQEMLLHYNFIRPSRKHLVNVTYLKKVTQNKITLTNGMHMPVSRRRRDVLLGLDSSKYSISTFDKAAFSIL